MISSSLFPLVALAAISSPFVNAQQKTFPATALASKHFPWPTGVPYQADTDTNLVRGSQHGYNICNSTTEGSESECQTSFINSIEDFCLWGPPEPNSEVGSTEGEMVAWCTKPGHGSRLIPRGALTGVQWIRAPAYVAVVGFIDQTKINIKAGDYGGEMDPHGADLRGNPLGGLVYSNSWGAGGDNYTQVIEWHNFIGSNQFCFKACDPSGPDAAHYCEHIYDRIGCAYNVPNNAQDKVFESCDGENQDFPGVYTGSDGAVTTYKQPAESLGPITSMPYQPHVPKTSNCKTYDSASLYSGLLTVDNSATITASSGASTSTSGASTRGGSSSGSAATGSGTAQPVESTSNDSASLAFSGISILGVAFSALFLS